MSLAQNYSVRCFFVSILLTIYFLVFYRPDSFLYFFPPLAVYLWFFSIDITLNISGEVQNRFVLGISVLRQLLLLGFLYSCFVQQTEHTLLLLLLVILSFALQLFILLFSPKGR